MPVLNNMNSTASRVLRNHRQPVNSNCFPPSAPGCALRSIVLLQHVLVADSVITMCPPSVCRCHTPVFVGYITGRICVPRSQSSAPRTRQLRSQIRYLRRIWPSPRVCPRIFHASQPIPRRCGLSAIRSNILSLSPCRGGTSVDIQEAVMAVLRIEYIRSQHGFVAFCSSDPVSSGRR